MNDEPSAEWFSALWTANSFRVHAYALRHVDPHTAEEVVSETFLVAWCRMADLPPDPLPWLLVVARNTIANHRRHCARAKVLEQRLARIAELALTSNASREASDAGTREQMLQALAALSTKDQEALLLVAWDGLSPANAAHVAGCSTGAFKVRLHRARKRLSTLMSVTDPSVDPSPHEADPAPDPSPQVADPNVVSFRPSGA